MSANAVRAENFVVGSVAVRERTNADMLRKAGSMIFFTLISGAIDRKCTYR